MPPNRNPWVADLLTWHGHAAGGVHVPFQPAGNPLGRVIDTTLVVRLRELAAVIAADPASRPRWIFLVGGPGNGKSETVQDFLASLDSALGVNGALTQVLQRRFSQPGLLPRKVEILPTDLAAASEAFARSIGRLVVVQDATATETALGNAASELADDLADLFTCPTAPPMPVFVACVNRGLLARAMNEAFRAFGANNEVTQILASVMQASSLGRETLAGAKPCWPLSTDDRFACWPLDVETLLEGDPEAPLATMLNRAVVSSEWEIPGRCQDCTSKTLCPFWQNAEWLRDEATKAHLLAMLRRGELARGQRWNFRGAFSLIAELVVGQWSDFGDSPHPCEWVHEKATALSRMPQDVRSTAALAARLYPHAFFQGGEVRNVARAFLKDESPDVSTHPLTFSVVATFADPAPRESTKPIRETIAREYSRLDPATSTPSEAAHVLRAIEDAFCQSVEQGRTAARAPSLARTEEMLMDILEKAEREWDPLGRDSRTAVIAVCLIRKLGAMLAKRSIGLRLGYHALDSLLAEYQTSLRDNQRLLGLLRTALQPLLGDPGFRFNLVEIIGQPVAERQPLVSLQCQIPGIRALPAPTPTMSTPGHDMPCIVVTDPDYRIPLTFDFYMALRLRRDGCAGSSLPASVRAALDRLRHRYAGELCRKDELFADGRASIVLSPDSRIDVPASGSTPSLVSL